MRRLPDRGSDRGAGARDRRRHRRRLGSAGIRAAEDEPRSKGQGPFGDRLGRVVLAVTDEPQTTRAWACGARGEEELAKALEGIDGLRVLHDRRVPGTQRNKCWILRPEYHLLVGRRDCSARATGLGWQVEVVTTALVEAGVDPLPVVTPVICFVDGDWPLFGAPDEFVDVRLEGPKSLRKAVTAAALLDAPSVENLARLLAARLPAK